MNKKSDDMRQIVLDTETTGLLYYEGHRIIEIACVEMIDRKITGKIFHTYLNPKRKLDASARDITGLNESFLQDKPIFLDILNDFLNFIANADEMIIHNAAFDVNFINNELRLVQATITDIRKYINIFDTLDFARKKHPGKRNNLNALCKRYNVDNTQRSTHGALVDADLLAKVYLSMTSSQYDFTYVPDNLNLDAIICNLHVVTLRANIQDLKRHINTLKEIKQCII